MKAKIQTVFHEQIWKTLAFSSLMEIWLECKRKVESLNFSINMSSMWIYNKNFDRIGSLFFALSYALKTSKYGMLDEYYYLDFVSGATCHEE